MKATKGRIVGGIFGDVEMDGKICSATSFICLIFLIKVVLWLIVEIMYR
jgi:hypothetical protein